MKHWIAPLLALVALAADAGAQCLVTKITGERGVAGGGFGSYLAAQGDELFVASLKSEATHARPGSIHAMRREGLHWYREAELVAPAEVVAFFGMGLAVAGDTLVAGDFLDAGGIGVYVFRRERGVWSLASTLDPLPHFGSSHVSSSRSWAAISGDRIAIGASLDSTRATFNGSVRLYRETTAGWELETTLTPDELRPAFGFGYSLDLQGERLVVGAPGFGAWSGATYVFERRNGGWLQTAKLEIPDAPDLFGATVSLDGERLAAVNGAGIPGGSPTYVFEHAGGAWTQVARLVPEIESDRLGETIELMGERLLVSGVFGGYLFRRTDSGWQYERALEIQDAEPYLGITIPAATPEFVFLASCGHNASDIWDEASDQRALDGGAVFAYALAGTPCATLKVTRRPISYGKHELKLTRGPASAGRAYYLIGSMSGTSPGTRLRGRRVPLNPDPYFRWTAFTPNRGAFTNNFGRLDGNGEATVRLDVPPDALALFEGSNVDHAFLEFAQGRLVHVSNVAQVRFFHGLR